METKRHIRGRRRWLVILAGLAALPPLAGLLLLSRWVREPLLQARLPGLLAGLPGGGPVTAVLRWPRLGRVELEEVLWVAGADTLLMAARLDLDVEVAALLRGDLRLRELTALGVFLDLPALRRHLPPGDKATTRRRWPRDGSLPGWPSLACARLRLEGTRLRLDSLRVLEPWGLGGRLELGRNHEPRIDLDSLWVELDSPALALRGGRGSWRPARGRLDGAFVLLADGRTVELRAASTGDDHVLLTVASGMGRAELDAVVERKGAVWQALRASGEVLVDHAAAGWPRRLDLEHVRGGLDVHAAWSPDQRLDLRWTGLEGGARHARLLVGARDGSLVVDSLAALGTGWSFAGHGRFGQDQLEGRLTVELEPASRDGLLPPDVGMWLDLALDGSVDEPGLTLAARTFRRGLELRLAAHSQGDSLLWMDEFQLDQTGSPFRAAAPAGQLARRAGNRWQLEGLRLDGLAGSWRLDGQWAEQVARFRVEGRVPNLDPMVARSLGLSDSLATSLDRVLRTGAPVRLGLEGTLRQTLDGLRLVAATRLVLPGPPSWASLLPAHLRLDGLGDVEAAGRLQLGVGSKGLRWSTRQEAKGSGWLDSLTLAASGAGAGFVLESLQLALPQTRIGARGRIGANGLDVTAELGLAGLALPRRLLPGLESSDAQLDGTLRLKGSFAHPELMLALRGGLRHGQLWTPRVEMDLARDDQGLEATLRLPQGMLSPTWQLDSLGLVLASAAWPPSAAQPAGLRMWGHGGDHSLSAVLDLWPESGWRVDGRLDYRSGSEFLSTARPFHLLLPADGGIVLDGLSLAGSLGELEGMVHLTPDSLARRVELSGELDLERLSGTPTGAPTVAGLQLGRLRLKAEAGPADLHLVAGLENLRSKWGEGSAELELAGTLAAPTMHAALRQVGDTLAQVSGRLPLRLSLWPPALHPDNEDLDLLLVVDGVPLPDPAPDLFLHGRARLAGTTAHPRLDGELEARPGETAPAGGYHAGGSFSMTGDDSLGTLESHLELHRQGRLLAMGSASLDLGRERSAPVWAWTPGLVRASLRADSISLEDLDPLLPADVWLKGRGMLVLDVDGPMRDPQLAGRLKLGAFELGRAGGTRLFGSAGLDLGGRVRHPRVRGRVEVRNGVVQLPELQRGLHDKRGTALLWEMAGGPAPGDGAMEGSSSPLDSLDLEVEILLPERLRVRGGDLDMEGRGQVMVRMAAGETKLQGDLEAVSGTFRLLGRNFDVQSGKVSWYGDGALSPELDLELATRVDNTLVTIRLTGSLESPRLAMTSEPALEEGEIMALLLFRRSGQELDNQQQDFLQRQATRLATDFGMEAVQAQLSRHLGLDLLRLDSTGEDGLGTLLVGKYLGPRVLLRFEQSLSQQDLYRLNVEYVLSRHLRLDTATGSRGQSGISLSWNRRW
jgi:hypothetical protein